MNVSASLFPCVNVGVVRKFGWSLARLRDRWGVCGGRDQRNSTLATVYRKLLPPPALVMILVALLPAMARADAPSIAVLPFEIEDDTLDQGGPSDVPAQQRRLLAVADIVRQQLAQSGRYTVVDNAPAATLIAQAQAREPLHGCNGCELDLARSLGAELVAVGWVQKVSNLIINLNLGIKRVADGRTLLIRSVDMRGNTDESWQRAARRLARDVLERAPQPAQ
jgi:hypothetical protein